MEQDKTVKNVLVAVGVSAGITLLFLLCMAVLMLKTGMSEKAASNAMIAGYVLAPAVGGFMLGKKKKVSRFLWGLLVGLVYYFIYFAIAVCVMDVAVTALLWVALPILLGGMAGGMLS